MSEHTPLTEAWAVQYARTYSQYGNEAESQAALNILADALAARTSTATADTGLRERVEAAIRLIQPDHLTPMGARQLRRALDATAAPTKCVCGANLNSLDCKLRSHLDGPKPVEES